MTVAYRIQLMLLTQYRVINTMAPSKFIFALAAIFILSASQTALGQLTTIVGNTGDKYGLAAWYSYGQQTIGENIVRGYGINIKYGPANFLPYPTTDIVDTTAQCKCTEFERPVLVYDTTWYLRASFGLGYLNYYGLVTPISRLSSRLDLAAPYAGAWLTVPVSFPFWGVKLKDSDGDHYISIIFGYTTAVVSIENAIGKFEPNAQNENITYTIPTTLTHEFNYGIVIARRLFIMHNQTSFKPKNVLYTPLDGSTINNLTLQSNLPSELDLSFNSWKIGFSVDF
jgi:hypothetical protein